MSSEFGVASFRLGFILRTHDLEFLSPSSLFSFEKKTSESQCTPFREYLELPRHGDLTHFVPIS